MAGPKSIQRRLFVWFVAIFIPLSLLLYFIYYTAEGTLVRKFDEVNALRGEQTAGRAQEWFQRIFMSSNLFINDKAFIEALEIADPYDIDKLYIYFNAIDRLQYPFFLNEKYAVVVEDQHGQIYESDILRLDLSKGSLAAALEDVLRLEDTDFFNSYRWELLTIPDRYGDNAQFIALARTIFNPTTAKRKGQIAIVLPMASLTSILSGGESGAGTGYEIIEASGRLLHAAGESIRPGAALEYSLEPTEWRLRLQSGSGIVTEEVKLFRLTIMATIFFIFTLFVVVTALVMREIRRVIGQINSLSQQLALHSPELILPAARDRHIDELSAILNRLVFNLRTARSNYEAAEAEKRKLEMDLLQQQINPHFLLNTLSTIRWIADRASQREISSLIVALSHLLRQQLYHDEVYWEMRQEREYLEKYAEIQSARHGGKITVRFDIEEAIAGEKVLKMLLQPIVENCYEHAFTGRSAGQVVVWGRRTADGLLLSVADDGIGLPSSAEGSPGGAPASASAGRGGTESGGTQLPQSAFRRSIGLENVRHRLRLHYGERSRLDIRSGSKGTTVTLLIPRGEDPPPEGALPVAGQPAIRGHG